MTPLQQEDPDGATTAESGASEEALEERLLHAIERLQADALALESSFQAKLERVHPEHRAGARNLLHYLSVRQRDIRPLQRELATLGVSSLGRMERCVLGTLSRVEYVLRCLNGESVGTPGTVPLIDQRAAEALLSHHTDTLLGPCPEGRMTRIMVTLSEDDDASSIDALLRDGMNVARINCAKGGPELWRSLVGHVRQATDRHEKPCPILFDLSGPNPRSLNLSGKASNAVTVAPGDRVYLVADEQQARATRATIPRARTLGCSLPEVIPHLRPGERVTYDDGKVCCVVSSNRQGVAELEVVRTLKPAQKLKGQKGLNFPDSHLPLPSLTEKDLADLDFVAGHADLVGLSFVRSADDVEAVQAELELRRASHLGLLLKIETTRGFHELGHLLLTAMRSEHVGVMVARGDMAVELGFVRLAEAQEEVLWLGEAALVPVVWATQVLESLCKSGMPSRAEVTDAAMGGRAECVMLNRGKYVDDAVRFLHEVLTRMQAHQEKKRSMLRRLRISELSRG